MYSKKVKVLVLLVLLFTSFIGNAGQVGAVGVEIVDEEVAAIEARRRAREIEVERAESEIVAEVRKAARIDGIVIGAITGIVVPGVVVLIVLLVKKIRERIGLSLESNNQV